MLERIQELLANVDTFAFETTLSTRSYVVLIKQVQKKKNEVILLFLALESEQFAINRVKVRVAEGGHNISTDVIIRRFKKGLKNLFNFYLPIVDKWFIADNSGEALQVLSLGTKQHIEITDHKKWLILKEKYYRH